MLRPETMLRTILGPVRSCIRPLVYAVEATDDLIFSQHFAMDDIKCTKHVYPYVAKLLQMKRDTTARAIERLAHLCWDALSDQNLVAVYLGDASMQMPPPGSFLVYLAVYAHLELPFPEAVKLFPDILFSSTAQNPHPVFFSDYDILEALRRAQPMLVLQRMAFPSPDGISLFPVCPACKLTFDRDFQTCCDHCGQLLDWSRYSDAQIIYPDHHLSLT